MGLADEARDKAGQRGGRCTVGALYEVYPDPDELREALHDSTLSATGLHRALEDRGYQIGQGAVERHRRGGCKCGDV